MDDLNKFAPRGLATAIGSMPHREPEEALNLILQNLSDIPYWPQLPHRSFLENMYVQYSERFPGVVIEDERIYVDRSRNFDHALEQLYIAYLQNTVDDYAISPDYAAGLATFLEQVRDESLVAVKGHVTGPISWGLTVTDQDRRPVLYDEILGDAIAKHLRLKAAWQSRALSRISPRVIIFVDEPYMSSFGSAFVSLSREQVIGQIEEVFSGIDGLKGVHCCGNTDWSVILATSVDILNFDAYNYAESVSLYPAEIDSFLNRGGIIAWGIVPNEEETLKAETVDSLVSRLEQAMGLLSRKGIDFDRLIQRCLVTPSCGLAQLSPESAARALELLSRTSKEFRRRYIAEAQV